jgi:hypothetical protein
MDQEEKEKKEIKEILGGAYYVAEILGEKLAGFLSDGIDRIFGVKSEHDSNSEVINNQSEEDNG